MRNITTDEARNALYQVNNPNVSDEDQNIALYQLEEFITQVEHFQRTRNIMIPMLLQKKE